MKKQLIIAVAALTLLSAVFIVFPTSAAQPLSATMEHEWMLNVGDTLWLDGTQYQVWKRMEALNPTDMKTYYYYQIAPERSMEGEWIWEGEISTLESRSETKQEEDPPPGPLCPPNMTPPPC